MNESVLHCHPVVTQYNKIMQHPKFPVISHYWWLYRKWSYHVETELPLLNTAWGGPSPLPSYALWCHCGIWVHTAHKRASYPVCLWLCVLTHVGCLNDWLTSEPAVQCSACSWRRLLFLTSCSAWQHDCPVYWQSDMENLTTFKNNGHSLVASERHELKGPQVAPADWETGRGQRWCCWRTEPFLSW